MDQRNLTNLPPSKIKWSIDKNDYILEDTIGSGATSIVHSAFCKTRNERVAIKRIDLERCSCSIDEMQKEIQAMSFCNHENVATYYTSFVYKSELWIVMKLLDGGSVSDLLNHIIDSNMVNVTEGILDEVVIATILKEVLKGLIYFHQNGQIHRDVKSGNILLGMDGTVQLADFGVSSTIRDYDDRIDQQSRKTFVGTPCWMAPEVMEQTIGYNNKVDIWSFGITALEMATGSAPYAKYPAMKVLKMTLQNDPPTLEICADGKVDAYKKYSKVFRKMVADCLQKNPQNRPEAKTLLKHKFFKSAKTKEFLSEYLKKNALNIHERSNKVTRKLGTSGKMVKSMNGDWVWPDEENKTYPDNSDMPGSPPSHGNITANTCNTNLANSHNKQQPIASYATQNNHIESVSGKETNANSNVQAPGAVGHDLDKILTTDFDKPKKKYNIIFRVRNEKNDLNEIVFVFDDQVDTCDGVAQELVSADLISGQARVVVAANLQKLIKCGTPKKKIVFALSKSNQTHEIVDEERLIGYAQLVLESVTEADTSN